MTMKSSWQHPDVFPIIGRIVEDAYNKHQRFISAREIAAALLEVAAAKNLVETARQQQDEKQSLEWYASNMVSWFSQRITIGESDWAIAFERIKMDGVWAYKPVIRGNG